MKAKMLFTFVLLFMTTHLIAQDFVYTPKNPSFGGNYLNYSWMLNSANAQNTIEEKQDDQRYSGYEYDPVADFEEDLQRRIFSELSNRIVESYFGETTDDQGLSDGEYNFGDYNINLFESSNGVNISIRDFSTGGETTITLPYY